ncbi:MAG TPA: DUF177 domain-containing protein [Clostridiales bacterium]|nr:DUF177 domain-containing protein [Clostridiales bacterium]
MIISLSDISSTSGKTSKFNVPIDIKGIENQGQFLSFIDKEPVDLVVTNIGRKKVLMEADGKVTIELFCNRCLSKIIYPMKINISKEVDLNQTDEERIKNLDEASYIINYELDLDVLICNEIILGFPMQVLCDQDCKGICNKCGLNLNNKNCDCDNTEYDPRMLAIRDIYNEFKEV